MHEVKTLIPGPEGQIETMVLHLEGAQAVGVMCHPHSLYGGSMGNKVVTTVIKAWQEIGMSTVRFNFRGVGESAGKFDEGQGEKMDLKAVIDWLSAQLGQVKIHVSGFSFGAYVALKFCQQFTPAHLLLIAPPVAYPDFSSLKLPDCPSDLIVAGEDEIVSTTKILRWAATQPFKRILNVEGSSHFFHGKLLLLKDFILTGCQPTLA